MLEANRPPHFILLFLVFPLALLCGCETNIEMSDLMRDGAHTHMQYDFAGSHSLVLRPPNGSRVFLTDGGDCVIDLTMDWKWMITFAGGEPVMIADVASLFANDSKRKRYSLVDAMFFAAQLSAGPCEVATFAAKQIELGGCGANAGRRAARRLLGGPYQMIGVDRAGTRLFSTTEMTEDGRKMLLAVIEQPSPMTSTAPSPP